MNKYKYHLKNSFSSYVLKAVKNKRSSYLEKKYKIEANEFSDQFNLEMKYTRNSFYKLDMDKELIFEGMSELKNLTNQIEDYKLFQIISGLTEKQKKIILLRVFYEQTFMEIGNNMGISSKKAENAYFNAIKKIRKQLGGNENGV